MLNDTQLRHVRLSSRKRKKRDLNQRSLVRKWMSRNEHYELVSASVCSFLQKKLAEFKKRQSENPHSLRTIYLQGSIPT